MRALAAAALSLAAALPSTASAQATGGWTEAVVSVADLEAVPGFLERIGDWRETGSGELTASELAYWQVKGSGEWRRLCAPAVDIGCIRFVRFDGVEQEPIRPAARAWDTGGIFSLMVRTDDVDALYEAALAEPGWWAESPPIRFQFGTSYLKNVVIRGPHGIQFAAYERISPEFTDFPVGRISQAFNSMRMVKNQPSAKAFYEGLGFEEYFDADYEPLEPQWSNFSIPRNFTPIIRRKAAALMPKIAPWGRVEVMQIVGFEGHDHSARAIAPNLGILSVRYPAKNLDKYRADLAAKGVPVPHASDAVETGGMGILAMFAVRSPDGALTEFYAPSERPDQRSNP
ncbi:VOC family protein [Erythrobacter sp.]|uniref:VOC family protein n=1 Tax=Erythrobacter sp. TaxID=1042 RepID=UPI003C70E2B9